MNNPGDLTTKIWVRDRAGVVRCLSARPGFTVMEILRDAGLPIAAICGGNCLCATCHIYVDEAWRARVGEPNADEVARLEESAHVTPASRLSCQIQFSPALDGLKVTVAPED
jgi:ferredoxin, 2Fe-2S